MPGFNGTGPRGVGPMTGGGRGFCSPWGIGAAFAGYGVRPGAPTSTPGAVPFAPQMTRDQELDFLKNQAQAMRGQLEQIEARVRDLVTKEK